MDTVTTTQPMYILGHDPLELKRLIQQSSFYNPASRQAFLLAGLKEGMRVLDVGCGVGDLSLIAADLVGPTGMIVGIDRAPAAIEVARHRVSEAGYDQISLLNADLQTYRPDEGFDAIVGRLILLYQPDPVATIVHLRSFLNESGFIVFQEFDMSTSRSAPVVPLFEEGVSTIRNTFIKAGMDDMLGSRLIDIYQQAGMAIPRCFGFQWISAGPDYNTVSYLTNTLKSLWPYAQNLEVVDPQKELHLPSLNEQIVEQVLNLKAILYTPLLISAWAKKKFDP